MTLKLEKKYISYIILSFVLLAVFVGSVVCYSLSKTGKRRAFIFPSADSGKYIVEYRYLPKNPVQGDINLYVDELLLGSGVERTKLLFTLGTRAEMCFLRNDTLYIDLSKDLLQMGNGVVSIREGVELLKKNIENNFPKVKQVEVFVDGKYAFESK